MMTTNDRVRRRSWGLACFWLCIILLVIAETAPASEQRSTTEQAIASTTTQFGDSQVSRAQQWGLGESEWQRYQTLMQGIRGSISPATLSPIEVLGIHARNSEERQRYAEQWAQLMHDDAERILAFQRAYDEAQQRLFPHQVLIDVSALSSSQSSLESSDTLEWKKSDRVLFFTDTQCPTCDAVLERLVSQISQFSGIDLYLTDVSAGDESRIRDWASTQKIDPAWVSERKITLNIDAGALDKVVSYTGQQNQSLPILILHRENQWTPLPVSRF